MLLQGTWYFPLLALSVAVYWALTNHPRTRLTFLLGASVTVLVYLLWKYLDNRTLVLLLATLATVTLASYAIGIRLEKQRFKVWLAIGVALPFVAFFVPRCAVLGICADHPGHSLVIPVSIGFFVLRQVHFVYECYRRGIRQAGLLEFLAYIFFFPTIIAGPLERFSHLSGQIHATFSWDHLTHGAERIVVGGLKKFVVADLLIAALLPPDAMTRTAFQDEPWSTVLFACLVKFLYVYFDFSGYTDMAIGTARLFGIQVMENFNFPLLRSNLAEFWRAWHISLSSFARDYVYFPLLVTWRNTVFALITTMLAIAAWHGTSPGWLLWGLHHGVGLVLLAQFQRSAQKFYWLQWVRVTLAWRIVATLATWTFVTFGYALTWHPDDVVLSARIYGKLWSLGLGS